MNPARTKRLAFVTFAGFIPAVMLCRALSAQLPEATLDHFAPGEDVNAAFAWQQGAQCTLSDRIGVVFRSDWQKRHWIKIAGRQVEFNGDTEMSDAGWHQTFARSDVTVGLVLHRVGGEPRNSDGVRLAGQIVISQSGRTTSYEVTGRCGA